jgi:hypothetical protein
MLVVLVKTLSKTSKISEETFEKGAIFLDYHDESIQFLSIFIKMIKFFEENLNKSTSRKKE